MNNNLNPTLLCIPYAGGSSAIYYKWKKQMESLINVVPLEMKGHGRRFNESLYANFEEGVIDLVTQIEDANLTSNFTIFGHSLGGMLAFEVARKLEEMGVSQLERVIVSGCLPPNKFGASKKEHLHLMNDDNFIQAVKELGGTSELLFQNKELLHIFLPIIKNDFKLVETYRFNDWFTLSLPLHTYFGNQDISCIEEVILEWNKYTTFNKNKSEVFNGGHFFIHDDEQMVISRLIKDLTHIH